MRQPKTGRRDQLIRAAGELFAERAYDEVTTTEIARRAGVAYGLIAHHFDNKRGLYLATVRASADRLRSVRDRPPRGDTQTARLRDAVGRHIRYIEANSAEFLSVMRGGNGSDPEVRAIVDELRWEAAARIAGALGVGEPLPPTLRIALRGWVGFLDEMLIDRLEHRDVSRARMVELAVAALVTAMRTAAVLDPGCGLDPDAID